MKANPEPKSAPARGRKQWLLLGLTVALCALLGVWSAKFLGPSLLSAHGSSSAIDSPADADRVASQPKSTRIDSTADPKQQPKAAPVDTPALFPGASMEQDDTTAELRLTCRDSMGNPVPGVTLHCVVVQPGLVSRRRHVRTLDCVIPDSGIVSLLSTRGHLAQLSLQSDTWYMPALDLPFDGLEHVLQLCRTTSVTVRARFDDGEPVTCDAAFLCAETGASWSFALRQGQGQALGVALQPGLQCCVMAQYRFPYQMHMQDVPLSELSSGQIVDVTVTVPAKPRCRIRLEVEGDAMTLRHTVMLEQDPGFRSAQVSDLRASTRSWESADLRPEGLFRLTVLGDSAWRSDWFAVAPGEVKVLSARLLTSSAVKARIVDESGLPVPGACLRLYDGSYLPFIRAEVPSVNARQGAVADSDGRVVLAGLPGGQLELEADAWRCTPVRKLVTLAQGVTVDLGELRLAKAVGEVFVQVVGTAPDRAYSIVVDQPGGAPVLPPMALSGASHHITGLAGRAYMIGIVFSEGGTIAWTSVDLSVKNSPTVTLDASNLRPD